MIREGTVILGIDPGTNILGFGIVRVDAAQKPQYVDMGVLDLRKVDSPYEKLKIIHDKVAALCELHHPDHLAIESPFYGRNAQVIFNLGRAQGAAMTAALESGAQVHEYAPRKAKIAVCGNGAASKEQVCLMAQKTLGIKIENKYLDATDALALALCHFYQLSNPLSGKDGGSSWEKFVADNPERIL